MTTWRRKRGDVGRTIRVGLAAITDISGAVIEGHVRRGTTLNNLSGVIVKAVADADGPCTVDLDCGATPGAPWLPTAAVGSWALETQLSWGTVEHTWPEGGYDTVIVVDQLDT